MVLNKLSILKNSDLLIISITNDLDTNHFEPTTLYRLFEAVDTRVLATLSDFADYKIKGTVFAYNKKSEFTDNLNASRDLADQISKGIYNVKVFPNELNYRKYINKNLGKIVLMTTASLVAMFTMDC